MLRKKYFRRRVDETELVSWFRTGPCGIMNSPSRALRMHFGYTKAADGLRLELECLQVIVLLVAIRDNFSLTEVVLDII